MIALRTLRALRSARFILYGMGVVICILVGAVCLHASMQSGPPSVTKVEPPYWWANHSINPVRLLLRGRNFTGAQVRASKPALTVSDILVNRDGTYLFVNVRVGSMVRPGAYPLVVETPQGKTTVDFTIERELNAKTNFRGIDPDDVIYLIMIDRFANGDRSNDMPRDSPEAANDRRNPRAYHGGDLRGIIDRLPYLKELGVTALWLTPWHDNWNGINNCDKPWCPNTYYHGYHAIDYYAVEDHFGTIDTLRELVEKAHALGIKIIQDQVANHVGSKHPWLTNLPLPNWFHGRLDSPMLNKFRNSVLLSPHANQDEIRNTLDGWFNEDLPDMNQEHPEVVRYEIQNSLWWVGTTGIDGIRQDTIQYMPRKFIRDLSDALHRQYRDIWMVGEVFERDAAHTAFFIGGHKGWDGLDTRLDSVFDFALWNASLQAFTGKLPVRVLRDQLKYDALYPDPAKVTTMVNNHDTVRFMSLPNGTIEGAMLHMALTLSVRGTPQLYYGEEIAMEGKEDPDNRRDFPGGFPGDKRNAFTPEGRTQIERRMYEWTRNWLRQRREHSAIRRGRMIDLFYDDDTYVFARQDKTETVVVAINRSEQEKAVVLPAGSIGIRDGSHLVPLIGTVTGRVANKLAAITIPRSTAAASIVQ
jgi:glycosidase